MADVRRFSDAEINRLVKFYEQAEREILDRINRALLKGNQTEYLEQMKNNVEAILQQLREGNRTWCTEAIPRVYSQGLYSADAMLKDIGVTVKAGFGAIHQHAAQVLAENTFQRLEDVAQVIGRQVNDIYRELALENVRGTVVGYDTWKQTARRYREQLAERGVTGFKDRTGRMWNMRTYTEMVARTTTMEAHLQGTANRLVEQGHDLVKISTHLGSCEKCQPWQGKVLSITGKTKGYPTLEEAKADGLFHPNCRHAYGLYIDLDKEIEELEREIEIKAEYIGDIEEVEKWEEKYFGDWVKSLSKEEKEAFEYYTMTGGAQQINDYLRAPENNKPDIDEPLKKAISLMENAIKRAVVPHDIMVHRSVSYNWLGEELKNELFTLRENFNVDKLVGKEFTEKGFTSTSLIKGTFGQAISINIQVPKGMHAAAIEDVSVVSNEHELLFPPGFKIKVVSAKLIKETGRIEIDAVAIKEKELEKTTETEPYNYSLLKKSKDSVFEKMLKEYSAEYKEKLTYEEVEAIRKYQSTWYLDMNNFLRGRADSVSRKTKTYIKNLQKAIKKVEVKENILVARGTTVSAIGGGWDNIQVDDIIKDEGFMSTSLREETAIDFVNRKGERGILMYIKIPKGTNGVIADVAVDDNWESELLLEPGTKIRITGKRIENGMRIIEGEVVNE